MKKSKSKVVSSKSFGGKMKPRFRNGGEVGGIGGGSGVDGSGNRGNGGYGGGTSGNQGGGGMGGGGKGGVTGTGIRTGIKTGIVARTPTPRTGVNVRPTSKPAAPVKPPAAAKPKPVGMAPKVGTKLPPGMSYGNYMRNPTSLPAGATRRKGL